MKALKLFKSMGMNIYEGKTIEAVQLLELSLGWGGCKNKVCILNYSAQH